MSDLNPYASFLDDRPLETILAHTPVIMADLAETVGTIHITQSPAPGKWSMRDIFCHLADCELVFAFRLHQTLAEDNHTIQPFDQDKWATNYSRITAAQALATFTALRHWNLLLLESALPAAANRLVTHPERGAMTFLTIVETMAGHDLNHLVQLRKLAGVS